MTKHTKWQMRSERNVTRGLTNSAVNPTFPPRAPEAAPAFTHPDAISHAGVPVPGRSTAGQTAARPGCGAAPSRPHGGSSSGQEAQRQGRSFPSYRRLPGRTWFGEGRPATSVHGATLELGPSAQLGGRARFCADGPRAPTTEAVAWLRSTCAAGRCCGLSHPRAGSAGRRPPPPPARHTDIFPWDCASLWQ